MTERQGREAALDLFNSFGGIQLTLAEAPTYLCLGCTSPGSEYLWVDYSCSRCDREHRAVACGGCGTVDDFGSSHVPDWQRAAIERWFLAWVGRARVH